MQATRGIPVLNSSHGIPVFLRVLRADQNGRSDIGDRVAALWTSQPIGRAGVISFLAREEDLGNLIRIAYMHNTTAGPWH